MATFIKADDGPLVEKNNLHYMPCQIGYNGQANVSAYFEQSVECNEMKSASFRGRPLHGQEIDIPEGYCGYVLKKPNRSFPSREKVYQVEQSFNKFNFWNLDRIPSKNDTLLSAFDWLDVSEALHSKSCKLKQEEPENINVNEE